MFRYACDFQNYVNGDFFLENEEIVGGFGTASGILNDGGGNYLYSNDDYKMWFPRQDYPEMHKPLEYVGGWAVLKLRHKFTNHSKIVFSLYAPTGLLAPVEKMTAEVYSDAGAGDVIRIDYDVDGYTYTFSTAIVMDSNFHTIEVRMSKVGLYFKLDATTDAHTIPAGNRVASLGQLTSLLLPAQQQTNFIEVTVTPFDIYGALDSQYLLADGQPMAGVDVYLYDISACVPEGPVTSAVDGFLDFSGIPDGSYDAVAIDSATGYSWYCWIDIAGGLPV